MTFLEEPFQKVDPLFEFSSFIEANVRRNEGHFCKDLRIPGFKG
jgi:hypothetical protein